MDNPNYSMEHRKGQHLSAEERHEIEIHLKDGWSIYQIAHQLKRPYNTIKNEVKRGRALLYGGRVNRYKAKVGETRYRENRVASRKPYKRLAASRFYNYVEQHFVEDQWPCILRTPILPGKRAPTSATISCFDALSRRARA